jgi:asparagine synthetase B (glutamine-hydrolysing)
MPEICGIVSTEELNRQKIDGLRIMRSALELTSTSQTESVDLSWASISVTTHHRNDTGLLKFDNQNDNCFAYIGNEQNLPIEIHHRPDNDNKSYIDSYFQKWSPSFFCLIANRHRPYFVELISDQFGLIPLYYTYQNGTLIFCTKLDPLLKCGLVKWKLNRKAIFDFFTFEQATGDTTFADVVSVLSPGTILTFNAGNMKARTYNFASRDTESNQIDSLDSASNKLYDLLENNVASAIKNHSRVAINLSGGFDSRALLGCALKHKSDIVAYTFGVPGASDLRCAQKLASSCGIKHKIIYASGDYFYNWFEHGLFVTSGMVSCNHYHILHLADLLSKEADVVLDGFAGDALTGGHLTTKMLNAHIKERAQNALLLQRVTAFKTIKSIKKLFHSDFYDSADYTPLDAIRPHFDTTHQSSLWYSCHLFDLYERQRRFIQYGAHQLRPFVNVKIPFLSIDIVNFMLSLDIRYLTNQKCYRQMLIKHMPSLAKLPDAARGIPISWPEGIRFAEYIYSGLCRKLPKNWQSMFLRYHPSTNYSEWYRTILRSFVEDNLLGSIEILDDILQKDTVESIVNEHMAGKRDHHTKIGCLLTFMAWYRKMKQFSNY